jgi:hypothetical protein
MFSFRILAASGLAISIAVCSPLLSAQNAGLQQKLESQYTLTKATADRSDIVTAGAVLVLEKDGLLMYSSTTSVPPLNTYKDGKISSGVFQASKCKFCGHLPGIGGLAGAAANVQNRTFVTGEKFWVTKIDIQDDGVVFSVFSDPISDVRYYALLKFPFPKGSPPDADHMLATVGEVLKVDDSGGDSKQQASSAPASSAPASAPPAPAAAQQPAPSPAAMAPIAPPPPPADTPPPQPKTVSIGQTKDQVVAIFGQPTKVANLGSKEIDYYPDFKITFVGGKVTNVQ